MQIIMLLPFRVRDLWCPEIDIETGTILNWVPGVKADIHFKVCDAGSYYLLDGEGKTVLKIENDYVPNSLAPGSYGDYIEMQVDTTGKIVNWPHKISFEDFFDD